MAIYNKPDESVFASSAKQGEVSNFPDIGRGWGVSFDQTGGIPPMEWFNFLFKRNDEKFGYLFQRGLSEWSATQSYPEGALVQYKNLTYKAKRANTNKKPDEAQSSDWQRWGFTQSELGVATLTGSGVTQLLTSINSDDETKSATPKSVKMAYDKGVEAKTAADNAQRSADDGINRANNAQRSADDGINRANNAQRSADAANNNANGRISKWGDTMTGVLTALGFIANSPTASVMFRSQTALSAFLDFAQKNTQHALTTLESIAFADNAAEFRMHLTPRGDNNDTDRRQHTFTFQPGGNIWSSKFGWFDRYFGKKPTFTYYQNHYLGASVYKIPFSDTQCLKITLMLANHAWSDELILPEIYNGQFLVNAIDAGGGTDALGALVVSNNRIKLIGDAGTRAAIFVFGEGPL